MLFDEIEGSEIISEEEIDWRLHGLLKLFYEWCKEANVHTPVGYEFNYETKQCTLYTVSPGLLIGYHGKLIDKYNKALQVMRPGFTFSLKEIKGGFANYIIPGKNKKIRR